MKLLVVEDDPKIADALVEGLKLEGFDVAFASTGEEAFFSLSTNTYDLVILDWMLPGRDGVEVLKALRKSQDQTPVLLLTARDSVEDRVRGLDAGSDDYLTKPFAFSELLARIRALLRRSTVKEEAAEFVVGDLKLNALNRNVSACGRMVDLTQKEFDLLLYFCRHRNRVVSRQMLAEDIWKTVSRATPLDNVIDVHIARLRKKIKENSSHAVLKTVRGVGFMLSEVRNV